MSTYAKYCFSSLLIFCMFIGDVAVAQDGKYCCSWIYSTGRYLGWADALLENSQSREAPSARDEIIYKQLNGASNSVAEAAKACEAYIPAWPEWRRKQSFLTEQNKMLQQTSNPTVSHKSKRRQVFSNINRTHSTWANALSIMELNGKVIRNPTCATCYFRFGFETAYASQAYRQAKEAFLANNPHQGETQMKLARNYLQRALETLDLLKEVQRPKGSFLVRCANLYQLDLESRILSLHKKHPNYDDIDSIIQEANAIGADIQNLLNQGCLPSSVANNSTHNTDHSVDPLTPVIPTDLRESILIVLDASGSMAEQNRIEKARNAARRVLQGITPGGDTEVGLITFSGCGNVRIVAEFTTDPQQIIAILPQIKPSSGTPLAEATAVGKKYLREKSRGAKKRFILLTDGKESCSGDPVAEMRK